MWYEILPCIGIVTVAVTIPAIYDHYLHKFLLNGNPYRRLLTQQFNVELYQRDLSLNGNPYKIQGLDSVPDE